MPNLYKRGDKDTRPWGTWEVLESGANFCVKKIVVNPNQKLSLQLHHFRNEHWIIVKGEALITLEEHELFKNAGENVFIPANTKHRIQNNSSSSIEFIEVQTGDNLDENDIIRFEDIYGRV
ncbi:MAG: cupin domain-containing protein [Alphaproteobacteria bacterium]|nr:cupin domain-containing protein [Alphaproteobacteria bacterium]